MNCRLAIYLRCWSPKGLGDLLCSDAGGVIMHGVNKMHNRIRDDSSRTHCCARTCGEPRPAEVFYAGCIAAWRSWQPESYSFRGSALGTHQPEGPPSVPVLLPPPLVLAWVFAHGSQHRSGSICTTVHNLHNLLPRPATCHFGKAARPRGTGTAAKRWSAVTFFENLTRAQIGPIGQR